MKSVHGEPYKLLISMLMDERKRQKLSQEELAKRIGIHQTFVSKYETLERRMDLIELRSVCKALDMDFVTFVKEFERQLIEKRIE